MAKRKTMRSYRLFKARRSSAEKRNLAKIARAVRPQQKIDEQIFLNSLNNKTRSHFMQWTQGQRPALMAELMKAREERGQHPLTGKPVAPVEVAA